MPVAMALYAFMARMEIWRTILYWSMLYYIYIVYVWTLDVSHLVTLHYIRSWGDRVYYMTAGHIHTNKQMNSQSDAFSWSYNILNNV